MFTTCFRASCGNHLLCALVSQCTIFFQIIHKITFNLQTYRIKQNQLIYHLHTDATTIPTQNCTNNTSPQKAS